MASDDAQSDPGAQAGDVRDEDYATLARFRHELRHFLQFSASAAEKAGLTPQQHQALLAIRADPGDAMPVGALAGQLLLRPHSASGLLDRLEKLGLVERVRVPEDRRQVGVRVARAGGTLLASLAATHRAELKRMRPLLLDLIARL